MIRTILFLTAAAALSACTMVTSDTPVFPPDAAAGKSAFEGAWSIHGDNGANILLVSRHDAATYDAQLFSEKPSYREGAAVAFSAIPLGANGDYVLQISCMASRDDDSGAWTREPFAFGYWTLTATRAAGDYLLGWEIADEDKDRLAAKYGQKADRSSLQLSALAPERARSLFTEWQKAQLAQGGDRLLPIARALDWSKPSDAGELDHPLACRDVKSASDQ